MEMLGREKLYQRETTAVSCTIGSLFVVDSLVVNESCREIDRYHGVSHIYLNTNTIESVSHMYLSMHVHSLICI